MKWINFWTHTLPKSNYEDRENLNRSIRRNEIEANYKTSLWKEKPRTIWLYSENYQNVKEQITVLWKLVKVIEREKTSKLNLSRQQYPDNKKPEKDMTKRENIDL
jgi:hypothetical protein